MNISDCYKLGKELYNMLLDKTNVHFIICPASMGDTAQVASYMTTYKKVRNVGRVIFVIKNWQEDLIKLFPAVDAVFPISDSYMFALGVYICQENLFDSNNILYGHFPTINDWSFRFFDHSFCNAVCTEPRLNLNDEYKGRILKIPLDSVADKISIPDYEANIDLREYKNSILLLPHARTENVNSNVFWHHLINNLKSNEDINKIYTNAFLPNEDVLENTEKCSLKVSEICYIAKHLKRIIGIRSGMFDLLNLVPYKLSMDVIHPQLVSKIFDKCEISCKHPLRFSFEDNPLVKIRNFAYVPGYEKMLADEIFNIV